MSECHNHKLDHVGIVVASISAKTKAYQTVLGAVETGPIVFDPIQKVNILFLELPDGNRIELIEPVGQDSPVRPFLEKGGGMNHLCYEVPDIERALADAIAARSVCFCQPTPAVAFGGRRVAFVVQKDIGIIEYVESAKT